jgi:hypothetical protein
MRDNIVARAHFQICVYGAVVLGVRFLVLVFIHSRGQGLFQNTEARFMSDFWAIKRLDGCPAIFLRFAGPDYVVVEVNRTEQILSRKTWADLPTDGSNSATEQRR